MAKVKVDYTVPKFAERSLSEGASWAVWITALDHLLLAEFGVDSADWPGDLPTAVLFHSADLTPSEAYESLEEDGYLDEAISATTSSW